MWFKNFFSMEFYNDCHFKEDGVCLEMIKDINPFVISDDHANEVIGSKVEGEEIRIDIEKLEEFNAVPFTCFSIEKISKQPLFMIDKVNDLVKDNGVVFSFDVCCIVVFELSPTKFFFIMGGLLQNTSTKEFINKFVSFPVSFDSEKDRNFYTIILSYVRNFCNKLPKSYISKEPYSERVKIKVEKKNKIIKIKNIIKVVTRKQAKSSGLSNSEYSHRFWVMGHWRKINGIGKDRNGDYHINGYTFVKEYIKGDDKKPIIQKTRAI